MWINSHLLAYSAMMSGREKEAMGAARNMWDNVTADDLRKIGPGLDRWMCSVYDVQKRFGRKRPVAEKCRLTSNQA